MTSALLHGSNFDAKVDKVMVLPEAREVQFNNKMSQPLFNEHLENENWRVIHFDTLREAYTKRKDKLDIYDILGKKMFRSKDDDLPIQQLLY